MGSRQAPNLERTCGAGVHTTAYRNILLLLAISSFLSGCAKKNDGSEKTKNDAGDTDTGDLSDAGLPENAGDTDTDDTDTGDMESTAVCTPDDTDTSGPVCAEKVETDTEFDGLSREITTVQYWKRATKYMVPVNEETAQIPALLQNANRYALHMDFLTAVFMPDLTGSEYIALVMRRDTREYYTGNFMRINDPDKGEFYGFTVYTSSTSSEQLEPSEVADVYEKLSAIFTAGPLAYTFEPSDALGPAKAKEWVNPGFPIYFPGNDEVTVEVYTPGTNYGVVHLYTQEEFDAAEEAGLLSYKNLAVIDEVPFDIEAVVAGVITGGRQWELSHVNVRMGRRCTPNLYVQDALDALAEWDGALVKLTATSDSTGDDSYTVTAAEESDAEAWWADHRPKLEDIPAPDSDYTALDPLTDMDVDDDPVRLVSRFGGKAANLAKLYAFLDADFQVPGFGIPFSYFQEFMASNTIIDGRASPPEEIPLEEYVGRLAADTEVGQDAALRKKLLKDLRERIETEGRVSETSVEDLADQIESVFGSRDIKVKFRSSSNVEDSLEFSGAGLYSSTAVCAADSLDADILGPSLCDSGNNEERSIERGLLTVWASLFNDRAWDERDWYQVPQEASVMGILVTKAFPDELVNGVAFTGDPSDATEARYLINAQLGDENVVGNNALLVPEKDLLKMDEDGEVSRIYRVRSSVLAEPGDPVLSDEQLGALGALMADIDAQYPLDLGTYDRDEILLDMEFKIDSETEGLKIKQIRPFLLSTEDAS